MKIARIIFISLSLLSTTAFSYGAETNNARHEDELQLGIGPAFVLLPDYPGSKHTKAWPVPLPYLNYQGRHFSLNREEIAWNFNSQGAWHGSVSINGLPPVERKHTKNVSNIDQTRDTTLEIGPSLIYDFNSRWQAQVAVRQVIGTDLARWQLVGWRFNPKIAYAWPSTETPDQGTQWEFTFSSLWNSAAYNDYFYQVSAPATPIYDATSGYGGSYLSVKYRYREKAWLWSAYLRAQTLDQATFADSPLVETKTAVTFGVAAIWIGYQKPLQSLLRHFNNPSL